MNININIDKYMYIYIELYIHMYIYICIYIYIRAGRLVRRRLETPMGNCMRITCIESNGSDGHGGKYKVTL